MMTNNQDCPQSQKSRQVALRVLQKQILALQLQEMQAKSRSCAQPQTVWAKRVYRHSDRPDDTEPGLISSDACPRVGEEEKEGDEDMTEDMTDVTEDMTDVTEDMTKDMDGDGEEVEAMDVDQQPDDNDQATQVAEPPGVLMGERLAEMAGGMRAQHKDATTRVYDAYVKGWQVCLQTGFLHACFLPSSSRHPTFPVC